MENTPERKVLVAVVAKKLYEAIYEIVAREKFRYLHLEEAEFETLILDVLPEACQLIKQAKGGDKH